MQNDFIVVKIVYFRFKSSFIQMMLKYKEWSK